MTWQLITIPWSHYCEKARWALDLAGFPYTERGYLPGLHLVGTKLRRRGRSVPVLVAGDECLTDSTSILQFVDGKRGRGPRLYWPTAAGEDSIEQLEDWLDEEFGPAVRLVAYHYLLADTACLTTFIEGSLSTPNRLALKPLLPRVAPKIRQLYRINDHSAARDETKIRDLFAKVSERLADGRAFLAGAAFSAADLTLAALAAPLLAWPDMMFHHGRRPEGRRDPLDLLPSPLAILARDMRATPAGMHCRRMYDEWRTAKKS